MGNKLARGELDWKEEEAGGDYRLKYRSWRQGEPETGPYNQPKFAGSTKSKKKEHFSDFEIDTSTTPEIKHAVSNLLDQTQINEWFPDLNGVEPIKGHETIVFEEGVFPPETNSPSKVKDRKVPSVSEMLVEELSRAVTDELVGAEYTSVKNLSPKTPMEINNSTPSNANQMKMVLNHLYRPVYLKVKGHLQSLPEWYTLKTPPHECAIHIRTLLDARRFSGREVAVNAQPQFDENHREVAGTYIIIICAKDRRQLLDAITRCVSLHASITEATIVTTSDGYALDRFVLTERNDEDGHFRDLNIFSQSLKNDIENVLASIPESPAIRPEEKRNGNKHKRKNTRPLSSPALKNEIPSQADAARFEVPFQEIRLVRVLGEGRTGKTYLAEWNGTRVAAKVLNVDEGASPSNKKVKSNLDEFRRELALVSKLNHPNIVKFLGASARPPRYIILFDLCEGGDVSEFLRHKDRKFSFFQVAIDVVNGLAFLHRNQVIHRDVKPENIMLDRTGVAKVADFGLSCYASGAAAEFTAETGTYRYMAPEVMKHEHYSFPCDVYSFAFVCYSLLTRKLPFDDCTPLQAAMMVARQNVRPKLPSTLLKPLKDLIRICWSNNPNDRLDFEQIATELAEMRTRLSTKQKKQYDWGFHDTKRQSFSPPTLARALTSAAV